MERSIYPASKLTGIDFSSSDNEEEEGKRGNLIELRKPFQNAMSNEEKLITILGEPQAPPKYTWRSKLPAIPTMPIIPRPTFKRDFFYILIIFILIFFTIINYMKLNNVYDFMIDHKLDTIYFNSIN